MTVKYYTLQVLTTRGWRYVCAPHGFAVRRFATQEEASAHGRELKKSSRVIGVPA